MTTSAGLLMYRYREGTLEMLLVHPGGPFWRKKDDGAWSICKGEIAPGEDPLRAAIREFQEETGFIPEGPFIELIAIRQKGGKIVHGWAFAGDCDPRRIKSNTFEMEWPPKSGRRQAFPEVDRAEFFSLEAARKKVNPAQIALLEDLVAKLST